MFWLVLAWSIGIGSGVFGFAGGIARWDCFGVVGCVARWWLAVGWGCIGDLGSWVAVVRVGRKLVAGVGV